MQLMFLLQNKIHSNLYYNKKYIVFIVSWLSSTCTCFVISFPLVTGKTDALYVHSFTLLRCGDFSKHHQGLPGGGGVVLVLLFTVDLIQASIRGYKPIKDRQ
jgi:hypothetical protein